MGTPDFAVPSLRRLHESSAAQNWQVVAVVTQPDRPAGRGGKETRSAVKEEALRLGLATFQPETLRKSPDAIETLAGFGPDVIVVAAYGLILPRSVLEIPTFGCINVHASLLPAYRGASPITAALLDGVAETGVTIMLMDAGMDTGPALSQARQPVLPNDTALSLGERLAEQGATMLATTLTQWLAGEIAPIPQGDLPGESSVCRLIRKEDGLIDWTRSAVYIERMTRAYTPWPGAHSIWRGQPFRIVRASVVQGPGEPGVVMRADGGVAVGTGDGLLALHTVQPAGRKAMSLRDFLNGARDFVGERLGAA
jgi:methionyl-tRNA formyltransferase